MLETIIFLLGSVGFVILSIPSFAKPRSHGFPRFFAFEALLGLVVLSARAWFIQPFSLRQLVSWAMLLDSIFLVVHAVVTLRRRQPGEPSQTVPQIPRLGFEKTTHLVTDGPYHFIRHPMYASLLWLAWGAFLKLPTLNTFFLVILASVALYVTAFFEEKENLQIFGDEYLAYMKRTKRFIPFLF